MPESVRRPEHAGQAAGTGERAVATFCRICPGLCGLVLQVEGGAVVSATGDRDNPASRGYSCRKGRSIGALHDPSRRFLTAQRGDREGGFQPMHSADAIGEIAERIGAIIDRHGPDAVGLFLGTQAYQATPTIPIVKAWLRAVGTHKFFRTMSIDQSAKIITAERLGWWQAGPQIFEQSDVWMFVGINPLVSMVGGPSGFPIHGGRRALRAARERGTDILVVDPRRTETAAEANLHVQLRPGTDALLMAALVNVILSEGLHDAAFCAEHVRGLDALHAAVKQATPQAVAGDVGVEAQVIADAARRFARARRGMAVTGTGPDMGPWSNLSEHLVQCLNVICGRFPRAGDSQRGFAVLAPALPLRAQPVSPQRPWDSGYRSRLGYGLLEGDLPTASLPREITEPGADRLRALIVIGGNPASAIPDQRATVAALRQLELLVTVDPFPTETAQLADYVIAPAMLLERPDSTRSWDDWYSAPFAQYTPAILEAPEGVIEDWKFFAELAAAMGLSLRIGSLTIAPDGPMPTTDDLLDHVSRRGRADLQLLRRHPHGHVFDEIDRPAVLPADESRGQFEVCPPDVAAELARALRRERIPVASSDGRSLLAVRRILGVMNTVGRRIPGFAPTAHNPCRVHPDQLAELGVAGGDLLEVRSAHGRVVAVAEPDDTLRVGVVTMTHCFGDLPGADDDPLAYGVNPGRLLSMSDTAEDINAMPRMTAVEVTIRPYCPGAA